MGTEGKRPDRQGIEASQLQYKLTLAMLQPADNQPFVLIDDAHTFGGTQIALAWAVQVLLQCTEAPIVCVCPPRTREAIEGLTGRSPRLRFEAAPQAMPLNLFCFPMRIPAYWRLLKRLHSSGARAWWLNLPDIEFGLAPLTVLRMLGLVPRCYLHGTTRFANFYQSASWRRRWLSKLRDFVADRFLFRMHRLLIAPSMASQAELQARLRGDPQPATAYLYPPGQEAGPPQFTPVKSDETDPVELWIVGNALQGHKNQLAALATVSELRMRGVAARLTVVGTGPDLEMLQQSAAAMGLRDQVKWLGWVADPWEATPRDAIVLVPSFFETLSLVAREALGHGLRIVVSPIPVFREWVPTMMIAASLAPVDLADAVLDVRRAGTEALSTASREALERFSHRAFAKEFAALSARVV